MKLPEIIDWIGKAIIIAVLVVLLVQVARTLAGADVAPVPAGLDSWTKWTGAMVALGLAIRGMAKGFRALL